MAFGVVTPFNQQMRVVSLMRVFAVAFAILFLVLVYFMSKSPTTVEVAKSAAEMTDVLVPLRAVEPGMPLTKAMFARVQRPAADIGADAVTDFAAIEGKYSVGSLTERQPLTLSNVTDIRPTSLISKRIPPGYRAVAIRVDSRSAVEGWAMPGARVDVVWTTDIENDRALKVIVEDAEVLSAERTTGSGDGKAAPAAVVPSTVTLLVTAKDSQKIQYASSTGSISLSLRGDGDSTGGEVGAMIDMNDMLGIKAPEDRGDGELRIRSKNGQVRTFVMVNGKLKEKFDAQLNVSPSLRE